MRRFIFCMCVIQCHTCLAGQFDRALNVTQRALQRTKPIKETTKKVTKKAKQIIKDYNIPEWTLATAGVAVKIVDSKAIDSTDLAPKLNMDVGDMKIRPKVRYELDSGNVSGSLDLSMDF